MPSAEAISELTALDSPTEASVCEVLRARLLVGEIYTGVSAMLLAVNPCEWLPHLYSEAAIERYLGSEAEPPPHIFRTSANVYRGMRGGRSQAVVISGESGAGKTQTFKRMMQFISAACCHRAAPALAPTTPGGASASTSVEALLIETVPILEAYGNATTPHNPDSSRFGKFVVMHFKEGGALAGIAVRTYLLETTRAVRQGEGERGFHVFHELLAGGRAQSNKERYGVAIAAAAGTPGSAYAGRPNTPRTVQRRFLDEAMAREADDDDDATAGDEARGGGGATPANNRGAASAEPSAGDEAPDHLDLLGFHLLTELKLEPLPPTRFLSAAAREVHTNRDDLAKFTVRVASPIAQSHRPSPKPS